jgi:phosphoribosyl-AMP cyclohydrolase
MIEGTMTDTPPSPDAQTDWLADVRFDDDGLVPAIAQEAGTGHVLMVAFMNREALARTAALGEAVYWSRSRRRLWHKGEESGHVQKVRELRLDCDGDVVLLQVEQLGHHPGIACHTGRHSCFYRRFEGQGADGRWVTVDPVLKDPELIYR